MVEDNGFDEFWAVYPRHVAKRAALKAFARALKVASPDTIIDGARRYAREKRDEAEFLGTTIRFIKHPATWLNGDCWEDDPAPIMKHNGATNGHQRRLDEWEAAFSKLSAAADLSGTGETPAWPVQTNGRREP